MSDLRENLNEKSSANVTSNSKQFEAKTTIEKRIQSFSKQNILMDDPA